MQYFKVFFLIMGIIFFLTNSIKGIFIYLGLIFAYFVFVFFYSLGTRNNPTRKFLLSAWNGPNSPLIYIGYVWEIDKALKYIKSLNSSTKITLSDYFLFCEAQALSQQDHLNGRIQFGNYIAMKNVDFTYITRDKTTHELKFIKIYNADKMSLEEIAKYKRDKKNWNNSLSIPIIRFIFRFPIFLVQPIMLIATYISQNLNLPFFGVRKRFAGVSLIYHFSHSYETSIFPMPYFCHVPLITSLNKRHRLARLEEKKIVSKECIELNMSIDHRYSDGSKGGNINKMMLEFLSNPEALQAKFEITNKKPSSDAKSTK